MIAAAAPTPHDDKPLTPTEAAELLGVAVQTLAYWRCIGKGPVYQKAGQRFIRYRRSDIFAWLDSGTVNPEDHGCEYLKDT